jgi:hypothetical protein
MTSGLIDVRFADSSQTFPKVCEVPRAVIPCGASECGYCLDLNQEPAIKWGISPKQTQVVLGSVAKKTRSP